MDINEHKVVRDLERVYPIAAHITPDGNVRIDMRVRFIIPKSGSICADIEFYDPLTKTSLNRAQDGNTLPLSSGRDDPVETFQWYMGLLAEMAYNNIQASRIDK